MFDFDVVAVIVGSPVVGGAVLRLLPLKSASTNRTVFIAHDWQMMSVCLPVCLPVPMLNHARCERPCVAEKVRSYLTRSIYLVVACSPTTTATSLADEPLRAALANTRTPGELN